MIKRALVSLVAGIALAAAGWAGPVINKITVVKQGDGAVVRVSGQGLTSPKTMRVRGDKAWIASFAADFKSKPAYVSLRQKSVRYVQWGWFSNKPPVIRILAWLPTDVQPRIEQDPVSGDWLIHIGQPTPTRIKIAPKATPVEMRHQEPEAIAYTQPTRPFVTAILEPKAETVVVPNDSGAAKLKREPTITAITRSPDIREYQGPQVSLDFTNTDVVQIVKALAMQTNANIIVAPDVSKSLTVSLHGETLTTALDLITKLSGLAYIRQGKTYIVGTPDFLKTWLPDVPTVPSNVIHTVTEIYQARAAAPQELATSLTALTPNVKATPGPQGSAPMLILQGSEDEVAQALKYLRDMDMPKETEAPPDYSTEIYTTHYVDSRDLAAYFSGETALVKGVSVLVGPGKMLTAVKLEGTKLGSGGTASAASAGSSGGQGTPTSGSGAGTDKGQPPRDIIVNGPSPLVAQVISLMQSLDKPQPQVVIEVKVMDVLRDDLDNLGIQWDLFNKGVINLQNISRVSSSDDQANQKKNDSTINDKNGNNTTNNNTNNSNDSTWKKTFDTLGDPVINAFNLSLNPKTLIGSVNGILNALVTNKRSKLLANPKVAIIDGEKAQFFIGDDIKYVESSQVTQTGTTFQIGTVLAGIQLNAVPRIAPDGTVTLALHPEVSLISQFNDVPGGGKLPQVARRFVDTIVRMQDGQTLVIGGLIRADEIDTMMRVPILADLPILGQLFRHRSKTRTNSEVVIFLTVRLSQS